MLSLVSQSVCNGHPCVIQAIKEKINAQLG
jgi:hypothetical protein